MLQASLIVPVAGRVKFSAAAAPFVANLGGHPGATGGQVVCGLGNGPPTSYVNGLGYAVSITAGVFGVSIDANVSPIVTVHQGMPFVANGALACDTVNPITFYLAGIPRVATGHVAIDPDTT